MACMNRGTVLTSAPFKFSTLWAFFFLSLSLLDGVSFNDVEHSLISWAGGYLMVSSAVLIFVYMFHNFMHKHDPRNYVETTGWFFLAAACFALAFFSAFWPLWFPISLGAFLAARQSTRVYA